MANDASQFMTTLRDAVAADAVVKIVLSKPVARGDTHPKRIDVRPVDIGGRQFFQFTSHVGTQDHHRNVAPEELIAEIEELAGDQFRNVHLHTTDSTWTARYNKNGCRLHREASDSIRKQSQRDHNRTRSYLIPDGNPIPFLVATGIMSPEGRVRKKHFAKFRQINRYVEFISDVVEKLPGDSTLNIVDFGCGKSYLTFATHYYLTQVCGRKVNIVGLDRRADVVETCRKIVSGHSLDGIQFLQGDIASYQPEEHVHLAISLHACDTATDDAIASAVAWQSEVILAVPCCQHELAAAMNRDTQPLMSRHGILHERFSALATDALRASWLETVGYSTQVIEFIDMEHTAKNLLIRAVRRPQMSDTHAVRQQIQHFCETFSIPPLRLQQRLEELPDSCRNT